MRDPTILRPACRRYLPLCANRLDPTCLAQPAAMSSQPPSALPASDASALRSWLLAAKSAVDKRGVDADALLREVGLDLSTLSDPMARYPAHLGLAFSQGAEGLYVQDRLRQDASALQTLFAQGAQVLVCGSKDMAAGVRAVLETLLAQRGSSVDDLRLQGRYREDVY